VANALSAAVRSQEKFVNVLPAFSSAELIDKHLSHSNSHAMSSTAWALGQLARGSEENCALVSNYFKGQQEARHLKTVLSPISPLAVANISWGCVLSGSAATALFREISRPVVSKALIEGALRSNDAQSLSTIAWTMAKKGFSNSTPFFVELDRHADEIVAIAVRDNPQSLSMLGFACGTLLFEMPNLSKAILSSLPALVADESVDVRVFATIVTFFAKTNQYSPVLLDMLWDVRHKLVMSRRDLSSNHDIALDVLNAAWSIAVFDKCEEYEELLRYLWKVSEAGDNTSRATTPNPPPPPSPPPLNRSSWTRSTSTTCIARTGGWSSYST
jgi:hypothetical protein